MSETGLSEDYFQACFEMGAGKEELKSFKVAHCFIPSGNGGYVEENIRSCPCGPWVSEAAKFLRNTVQFACRLVRVGPGLDWEWCQGSTMHEHVASHIIQARNLEPFHDL